MKPDMANVLRSVLSGLIAIRDYVDESRSHTRYCSGDEEGAPCDCPNFNPRDVIEAVMDQAVDAINSIGQLVSTEAEAADKQATEQLLALNVLKAEIERLRKEAGNARLLMGEIARCPRCESCAQSASYHLVDFPVVDLTDAETKK